MHVADVRADLLAEHEALDTIVSELTDDQWAIPTASPRWSVADQIAHLAFFDRSAALAITDPEGFATHLGELLGAMSPRPASGDDHAGADDGDAGEPADADADDDQADTAAGVETEDRGDRATLGEFRAMTPSELLAAWRTHRATLADAAATLADDDRVAWYGPSMGAKSFLTARLMETWAHGQDIVDAVGAHRPATERLRHIAQLGFITRGWSYLNRGLAVPAGTVRLELTGPGGDTWVFGPDDADETVSGDALDFCLVVTQRRHLDDTALSVGELGRDWLAIAQAFAGAATDGPAPR
ncbi:MAG: maleylpyruvate isomerase family mycothiol-dependent enzyme [Acidimicrobiales bacterium]